MGYKHCCQTRYVVAIRLAYCYQLAAPQWDYDHAWENKATLTSHVADTYLVACDPHRARHVSIQLPKVKQQVAVQTTVLKQPYGHIGDTACSLGGPNQMTSPTAATEQLLTYNPRRNVGYPHRHDCPGQEGNLHPCRPPYEYLSEYTSWGKPKIPPVDRIPMDPLGGAVTSVG